MANAKLKTKPTGVSAKQFIETIAEEQKRVDCLAILKMMEKITHEKPKMWGTAIIGFCDTHLIYSSGRELDWFKIGFSPRKKNITLYLSGVIEHQKQMLDKLGKHKIGGGCLYIQKLSDINTKVLEQIIEKALEYKFTK